MSPLDLGDVLVGLRAEPAPGVPAPDAAPHVPGLVGADVRHRVEPGLVAVVARPPDRVRGVRVHRRGRRDRRPAGLLVRVPVLQDAPALRAQAGHAVHAQAVAGRAAGGVPVAQLGLPPPAFHGGLGEDDVLADAPLAGRPAQDLAGRPGEVPVDPGHDLLVRLRLVGGEEVGGYVLALGLVVRDVRALVLGDRPGPHPSGALRAGRQRGTHRQRAEVGGRLAGVPVRCGQRRSRL